MTHIIDTVHAARAALANTSRIDVRDRDGSPWTLLDIEGDLRARPRHLDHATPRDLRAVTTVDVLLATAGPLAVE
jgi:hypothetical protein